LCGEGAHIHFFLGMASTNPETPSDVYASHVARLTEEAKQHLQDKLPSIMRKAYFDMLVGALDGLKDEKNEKTLAMFLGLYKEIRGYLVKAACEGRVNEAFEPLPSVNAATRSMVEDIHKAFDPELFERMIRHDALDKTAVRSMVDGTAYWLRILLIPALVPRFEEDYTTMVDALESSEMSLGKATSVVLDNLFKWLD